MANNKAYKLDKTYWTERDFKEMGWHDSRIHGISFESNNDNFKSDLIFDIDYIFKWVDPMPPKDSFSFWVSPCTLVFHDVLRLKMNLDTEDYLSTEIEISDIEMTKEPTKPEFQLFQVKIETNFGPITFETSGFEQYVRISPKHTEGQWLDLDDRNGISFEKNSCN